MVKSFLQKRLKMRSKQQLPYPLRVADEYMEKLKIVAKENGRSVNKEIEMLIKNHVGNFEAEHGPISLEHE